MEAVTNAARHSGAPQVQLSLSVRGRQVTLTVSDRGRGLAADTGDGMGLKIMHYRAQMMDGTLRVGAARPSGTRVVCRLLQPDPVDSSARAVSRLHAPPSRSARRKTMRVLND